MRLYARFSYNYNDLEYSFVGEIERAIEWTESYNHWDGCKFEIEHGILMGEYDSYNGDADDYQNDLDDLCNAEDTDIKFCGLHYYGPDRKPRVYKGTVIRFKEEGAPNVED